MPQAEPYIFDRIGRVISILCASTVHCAQFQSVVLVIDLFIPPQGLHCKNSTRNELHQSEHIKLCAEIHHFKSDSLEDDETLSAICRVIVRECIKIGDYWLTTQK